MIDPPYNTGAKDWKYNNDFVDNNDTYRHSKWLSFMSERLLVSRDLLSEKGIIAVSIDHFELSQLTILMDTIFGEQNRIGIITVVHKPEGRNQEKFFGTSNEFCLFYARDKSKASFSGELIMTDPSEFEYKDEKGPYTLKNFIRLTDGKYATKEAKPNFYYPIYVDIENKVATTEYNENYIKVYPITDKGVKRTWKTLPKTFDEYNKFNNIKVIVNGDRIDIYEKQRPFEVVRTHWLKKEYHSYHYGTKILTNILGRKSFDFPKSVVLMKDIIKLISNKNSIILDFFAGARGIIMTRACSWDKSMV